MTNASPPDKYLSALGPQYWRSQPMWELVVFSARDRRGFYMRFRFKFLLLATAFVSGALPISFAHKTAASDAIVIAVAGPMSGDLAHFGQSWAATRSTPMNSWRPPTSPPRAGHSRRKPMRRNSPRRRIWYPRFRPRGSRPP